MSQDAFVAAGGTGALTRRDHDHWVAKLSVDTAGGIPDTHTDGGRSGAEDGTDGGPGNRRISNIRSA